MTHTLTQINGITIPFWGHNKVFDLISKWLWCFTNWEDSGTNSKDSLITLMSSEKSSLQKNLSKSHKKTKRFQFQKKIASFDSINLVYAMEWHLLIRCLYNQNPCLSFAYHTQHTDMRNCVSVCDSYYASVCYTDLARRCWCRCWLYRYWQSIKRFLFDWTYLCSKAKRRNKIYE